MGPQIRQTQNNPSLNLGLSKGDGVRFICYYVQTENLSKAPVLVSMNNKRKRYSARDFIFLGLFGLLVCSATFWLLKTMTPTPEPVELVTETDDQSAPFEFSSSVLNEPNDFRADIKAAVELITEHFSYLEYRQENSRLDLVSLEKRAQAILGDQPNAALFNEALTLLVAGLCDGHGFVNHSEFVKPKQFRWPFNLVEVDEGIVVGGLELIKKADGESWGPNILPPTRPGEAPKDALQIGDVLISVSGRSIEDWIAEAQDYVFASTAPARRRLAIQKLGHFDDMPERQFIFNRPGKGQLKFKFKLYLSILKLENPSALSVDRTHKILDQNIGYFRPGNFAPPPNENWETRPDLRDEIVADMYGEFDQIIGELKSTSGLILDLRGNPGGTDKLGNFLVDRLVNPGYVYYQLSSKLAGQWRFFDSNAKPSAGSNSFRGPLVCLLDEYTFSTADNVAACLKDVHPDVTFVGRPNGAGTGAPRYFKLPRTGASIRFCTMQVKAPNGAMAEGISVPIDIPIVWTRQDLIEGRDPDLAAAVDFLVSRLDENKDR